ncbi:hypothetical protein P7K49_029509 [Saguinus oedipus]|uniref:Secreted protein n=1 Tax=Saguinus oedipus TaxID=9490 RepID=A0ABQ9U8A0_SAGOE|nr:hypothetical protein P7K49_029509 [Saguinus oedipus]
MPGFALPAMPGFALLAIALPTLIAFQRSSTWTNAWAVPNSAGKINRKQGVTCSALEAKMPFFREAARRQ